LIKEQSKWWVTQLHNQVSELSTSNDPGAKHLQTKLKQQIHHAYEKQIYNKLKEITGKHKKYEDPHIVAQVEGRPTVIRDPDKVAQRFRDHNITHFAQASGCILSSDEYQDMITLHQFNSIEIPQDSELRQLREELNKISIEANPDTIELDEWNQRFKHWRESTTTSPSGLHLGHFKSCLEVIYIKNQDQVTMDLATYQKQQTIGTAHWRLVNLILQTGQSIKRWQKCNNICIPKRNDNRAIDKFRNIHIYECNLNAVLATKWKEAIHNSEEQGLLCESQFGSHSGKSSQIPVLLEILQHDICRMTRRQYDQINYDAKACYDRILPNLASIISGYFGVHGNIVRLHHNLLQNMQYHVTVARSTKEWVFSHSQNQPIYGTG
jgi:hypothetical protein